MDTLVSTVKDCALVFEGGGYRASYTAGYATLFLDKGIYFDFVCGISAGAVSGLGRSLESGSVG